MLVAVARGRRPATVLTPADARLNPPVAVKFDHHLVKFEDWVVDPGAQSLGIAGSEPRTFRFGASY